MRVSNTPKRYKNKNNGSRRVNNISNNNYEGNGKDSKIKGNPIQVHEKYQALARDAISSGDTIKAEYYFQHAEHYHRIHQTSAKQSKENENDIIKDSKKIIKDSSKNSENSELN